MKYEQYSKLTTKQKEEYNYYNSLDNHLTHSFYILGGLAIVMLILAQLFDPADSYRTTLLVGGVLLYITGAACFVLSMINGSKAKKVGTN